MHGSLIFTLEADDLERTHTEVLPDGRTVIRVGRISEISLFAAEDVPAADVADALERLALSVRRQFARRVA